MSEQVETKIKIPRKRAKAEPATEEAKIKIPRKRVKKEKTVEEPVHAEPEVPVEPVSKKVKRSKKADKASKPTSEKRKSFWFEGLKDHNQKRRQGEGNEKAKWDIPMRGTDDYKNVMTYVNELKAIASK